MFRNYLKVVLRSMNRQKIYAGINIMGLAIGMAGAMFILLWVEDEKSYDRFHENADRIYRAYQVFNYENSHLEQTQTPGILATRLKEDCPEVELVTRLRKYRDEYIVLADDKKFNEGGLGIADEAFFHLFSFPLVEGDPRTVLTEPYTVVLSETARQKYFGETVAVGRVLNIFETDYTVTGVFEDMPDHSHVHVDVLCSFASFERYQEPQWGLNVFKTYVLLREGGSVEALEEKLAELVRTQMFSSPERYDEMLADGYTTTFPLQPLTDIHLNSHLLWEFEANGSGTYVKFFSVIAVFILVIAVINYMNLSTARSAGRAREVGIRKTVGATRSSLIRLFQIESIVTALGALFLSLTVLHLLMPAFRNLVGKPWLTIPYLEQPILLLALIALAVLIGMIAGIYPAFFLSSFRPLSVLGGKSSRGLTRSGFRNGLVVFQFSLSILLLTATFVVQKQMIFIHSQNLGYDQDQVLVIKTYGELDQKLPVLKQTLMDNPSVMAVSASSSVPGSSFDNIGMGLEGTGSSTGTNLYIADADFQETMKMEMVEGRFFSREIPTDRQAVIINESKALELGVDDLIDRRMNIWVGGEGTEAFNIIGIIKDFHYESFHEPVKPMVMVMLGGLCPWPEAFVSIRVHTGDMQGTMANIQNTWNDVVSGTPFEYAFLDAIYNDLYQNDERTGSVFTIFTLFALFVACLGLVGLASFAAEQRTKEIGIRKVLGAHAGSIILLLSREYQKLIAISILIAWPLAFFLMQRWLQAFAYQTSMGFWVFCFSGLLALLIAYLAVIYHSLKAASANPVDALKYE